MFKLQRLEITGFKSFSEYTEIVFTGNGITAIVGPNGCGKCVSGDTLITLADGREVEIREIVETALRDSVFKESCPDGEVTRENPHKIEILSLNPQTFQLEPRPVAAFVKRATTPQILLVKTKSGRQIKATPYHPLFTLENGNLRAVRADEIKKGLRIAAPRQLPVTQETTEIKFAEFLRCFEEAGNIFIPSSDELRDWTNARRKVFGTFEKWSQKAGVSYLSVRGLRDGQGINSSNLTKLALAGNDFPQIKRIIKSRGCGLLNVPSQFTPDLARFLGLLIAEGRNTTSNQIWFVNSDESVNREFARLAGELFGVEVCRKTYKKGATDSLIFSRSLCVTLEKLFNFQINSNSFEKEAPPQIFTAEAAVKWAFLSGLFEGDGYVCARRQKNNGKFLTYLEYTTASEKLARQVVSLLLHCGVFALLRPPQKFAANTAQKMRRTYFSVLIYGSENCRKAAEKLSFVGKKNEVLERLRHLPEVSNPNNDLIPTATFLVKKAAQMTKVKIKPNRKECPKLAAYYGQTCEASRSGLSEVIEQIKQRGNISDEATEILTRLKRLSQSDVYWDEVVSVEEIEPPDEWVYDLSVAETHNFVAGNIIVHNSNVSDSITWVLGEQRAKNLRGGEMQDVIFAGTKSRQPSGMAEVVLHLVRVESEEPFDGAEIEDIDEALSEFDSVNSQHLTISSLENGEGFHGEANGNGFYSEGVETATITKLQTKRRWKSRRASLDFAPGEAVSVTRRLYRSGDSEYLLNGRACRLRDIQDLFAGTGLSGGHYALVQQEKISQILSAKPAERRQLIEEAAGISKFRTRQRAAEIRLESAKSNLRRISDIVSEIEKQANSLRRQAARTRRYKEFQEALRELLRKVFAAEGRELSQSLADLHEKLTNASAEENRLIEAIKQQTELAQNATQNARNAEEKLAEIRQIAGENALQRERISRDFAHGSEQVADLEERSAALRQEIKTLNERLAAVSADAARLREKNLQSNSSLETEANALKAAEENYQKELRAARQIESEIEKMRHELFQHTTAAERLREIARHQENALERLAERAEGLEKEGERAAQTHAEKQNELLDLQTKIGYLRDDLQKLQAEKQAALNLAKTAREELQAAEKTLAKLRDETNSVKTRRETLEKLDNQNALLAPAVQKLFAAKGKIGVQPKGTLADFLRVEARFERAVEAVFGANLQTVIVENREDVNKISEWLKTNKSGSLSVTIGSFEQAKAQRRKDVKKISDLLGISDELEKILNEIFPQQLNFRLVENLAEAADFSEENCVTLNGEIVYRNRYFVFGNQNEKQGILSFKRELRELGKRAEELKIELENAETTVKNLRENFDNQENTILEIQSGIVLAERELMSSEVSAESLEQEIERAERHKRIVEDEKKRLEIERRDLENKRQKAELDSQIAESEREKTVARLDEISSSLAQAREKAERANHDLSEKRAAFAAAVERRRSLQNAARRVEQEQAELKSRIEIRNNDLSNAAAKLEQLRKSLAEMERQTANFNEEKEREGEEIASATKQLLAAREEADKKAAELNETNAKAARAKDTRSALEVQQAEIATRLQNLHETCLHDLNQPLQEIIATEEIEDFDLPSGKRRAEDLREKIESFGAVNLLALEELREAEERLLFLTSQRKDIVDSIAAAEDALDEIKRRSREKFEEAFTAINRNFSELFAEIFGGGRGEMSLLDAADVLESGVEIVAQPPGKRLQNLLLLSGGEKALTAIALVLAIFRFRPAPFCLLDEVDAPLDEANVGRFVEKIEQMAEKTQFIVITHNKRTMEAARALYGVTMEEAGVSKVVSVKFE